MNGQNSDFSFVTDDWDSTITTLTDAATAMNDIADRMKDVVKNSLLVAGLSGDTANLLADKYDEEVLKSVRQFSDILNDYIEVNQKNLSAANEMSEAASRIASS
jgi:methyl-accepting chemotaxis protein